MVKKVPAEKDRIARFNFAEVDEIKKEIKKRPELESRLRKDFIGTLKAEGIIVDSAFREKITRSWEIQVRADLKDRVERTPESGVWYLKRVIEGKPINVHVKINRQTGKHEKTLVGGT